MARATEAGLGYVGDADFGSRIADAMPDEVAGPLAALSTDLVTEEQYSDFITNRMFRESLLCRGEVEVKRAVSGEVLRSLFLASQVTFLDGPQSDGAMRVRNPGGNVVSLKTPVVVAAVKRLTSLWPQSERFDDLVAHLGSAQGASLDDAAVARLAGALLTLYQVKMVEFRSEAPACIEARRAGERPVASAVARAEVGRGGTATNARHEAVRLDAPCLALLPALDGTRTRAELAAMVAEAAITPADGAARPGVSQPAAAVEAVIEQLGAMSLVTG